MHNLTHLKVVLDAEPALRSKMPITWFTTPEGNLEVLSRYGDDILDFRPYLDNPAQHSREINVAAVPEPWRASFREVITAYWFYGRPGFGSPKASTVVAAALSLVPYLRWLADLGVYRFEDVQPVHATSFATYLRNTPIEISGSRLGKLRSARGLESALSIVSLAWDLRERLTDRPTLPPWGDRGGQSSAARVRRSGPRRAATYCLSDEEASVLFRTCEDVLEEAEPYLTAWAEVCARRDQSGNDDERRSTNYLYNENQWLRKRTGFDLKKLRWKINEVRGAAGLALGLLVGLRVSELLSLEFGCCFRRRENGEVHWYIKGRTYKTRNMGNEATEWLAPPYVQKLIKTLERINRPLKKEIEQEILRLRAACAIADGRSKARLSERLSQATRGSRALFISYPGRLRAKPIMQSSEFARLLTVIKERAGVQCHVTPHVLRRTFAVLVVNSCNGDLRYLRKHFKHWSIETTALYASCDKREQGLVDEIAEQMLLSKVALIVKWLEPAFPLAGRAGEHFTKTRQNPEFRASTLKEKADLAHSLADGFDIRDTGHSFCIFKGVPSCGGRGLYDPRACAECDGAVITRSELDIWRQMTKDMITLENRDDCGPAGKQVIERCLSVHDDILRPFGLSIESIRTEMAGD